MGVTFSTSNGSASDALKIVPVLSATVKAKIDPRVLKDVLPLLRGHPDTKMSIIANKVIRIDCTSRTGATATLVSALAG